MTNYQKIKELTAELIEIEDKRENLNDRYGQVTKEIRELRQLESSSLEELIKVYLYLNSEIPGAKINIIEHIKTASQEEIDDLPELYKVQLKNILL